MARDLHVATMSGKNHVLMLEQMLWTLSRTWEELPQIRLLSDGTFTSAHLARIQRGYTGTVELVEAEALERHHESRGRPELVEFSRANYFGRKLAFIIAEAELHPTLWADNDILFYGDFSEDLRRLLARGSILGATRDASFGKTTPLFGYDPVLAKHLFGNRPDVPSLNAGFCFASGPVYDAHGISEIVRWSLQDGRHGYLTEQTIVAYTALASAGILWDEPVVHMADDDIYTLGPTYRHQPWKARHYTGNVRHLFWRDAFCRRCSRS